MSNLVARGREAHERLMGDRCVITRPSAAEETTDPVTGKVTPGSPAQIYAGKCRLRSVTSQGTLVESGERKVTVQQHRVYIPVGPKVEHHDEIRLTTGILAGVRLGAREISYGTHATATIIECEQVETG